MCRFRRFSSQLGVAVAVEKLLQWLELHRELHVAMGAEALADECLATE
jgi:hypothetical protein